MIPYKIIDVTMWMDNYTFTNDQVFSVKGPFNRIIGDNPEYVCDLYLCTQTGTHIQGGHYFRKKGKQIEEYPLTVYSGHIDPPFRLIDPLAGGNIPEGQPKNGLQ